MSVRMDSSKEREGGRARGGEKRTGESKAVLLPVFGLVDP
jgi:hypothetical protein